MISIRIIEVVISFITISVAYTICTTIAGFFQAWVAKKMGDSSQSLAHFLTLNPLVHIDPIGAFFLFFLGLGWGKIIPINPFLIKGPWRLLLVFLSRPFMYAIIACCSLLVLLRLFGLSVLNLAITMVLSDFISLSIFAKGYPASHSLMLSIALILTMMVYVSVMFAVLNFIFNGFQYALLTILHRTHIAQNELLIFLIPLILMIFFAHPLKLLVVYVIGTIANSVGPWIGAI